MTTTLRMFYARALFALCFFFLAVLTLTGVAFAQEAAPAAPTPAVPWWLETGVQAIVLVLGAVWSAVGVWQAKAFPGAKAAKTALDETLDAMHWENHVRNAVFTAFGYAAGEVRRPEDLKTNAERAEFLRQARGYMNKVNAEVPAQHGDNTDLILLAHLNQITGSIKDPPPVAASFANLGAGVRRKVEARN